MKEGRKGKTLLKWWFVVGCLGLLSACAGPKKHVTRQVSEEENTFYSSVNPRVKLVISPELNFLGKIEETEYDAGIGVPVRALSYFFGDVQEEIVRNGFLVRILTIPASEDFLWDSQIFSGVTKKFEAGTVEIEERSYEYVTTILPEPLADYEEQFITAAGYTLPHFFMEHALGQLDSTKKVKSYLLYFNHIDPAEFNGFLKKFVSDDWDETDLSADEKQVLQEFLERFQQEIQFLTVGKTDS